MAAQLRTTAHTWLGSSRSVHSLSNYVVTIIRVQCVCVVVMYVYREWVSVREGVKEDEEEWERKREKGKEQTVCVCVHVCVWMCVWMRACVCVSAYACLHALMQACMYKQMFSWLQATMKDEFVQDKDRGLVQLRQQVSVDVWDLDWICLFYLFVDGFI